MLKTMLLALTAALVSSHAFAYDQADRDARLGRLVERPGVVVVQPGQASLIQYAPRVAYAPAPVADPGYQPPAECDAPAQSAQTMFISQPGQTASLRQFRN